MGIAAESPTFAIVATGFGGPEVLGAVPLEVGEPGRGEVNVQVRPRG